MSCGYAALWSIKASADGETSSTWFWATFIVDVLDFVIISSKLPHKTSGDSAVLWRLVTRTQLLVRHIQAHCRLQFHSCVGILGDTPCSFYSWPPPEAHCKNNNTVDRLGTAHFKLLHVQWNSSSRSLIVSTSRFNVWQRSAKINRCEWMCHFSYSVCLRSAGGLTSK